MISPKQQKILAFPYSGYDAIICDGAVRSGKTSIMMVAFVDWAMREFSGQRFGICGKTVDSAVKNIIVPYTSMTYAKERYSISWRRGEKVMEVKRGEIANVFEVFGGRDESSYALIQGRTLAGVLLDEVPLMPQSFFNQALARCSADGARMWFSCNPASPKHWFFVDWIQRHKERNALYLHFEMHDNPSLSEKTLKRYEAQFTGVFYDRYIRGLWVTAEGAIYRPYADAPERFLVDEAPPIARAVIGVDFGGGTSAHAFSCVGFTPGMNSMGVLAEWYCKDVLDPERLSAEFVDFVRMCQRRWLVTEACCDSAEQVLIRGLRRAAAREGVPITVRNALKKPINDRIRALCMLMASGRFFVLKSCPKTSEALMAAVWDERSPTKDVRLDDGTMNIDSLDAMEYAYEREIGALVDRGVWR